MKLRPASIRCVTPTCAVEPLRLACGNIINKHRCRFMSWAWDSCACPHESTRKRGGTKCFRQGQGSCHGRFHEIASPAISRTDELRTVGVVKELDVAVLGRSVVLNPTAFEDLSDLLYALF